MADATIRRPTLRDVARAAGVSTMTVSRVVSGSGAVSPALTSRVQRAVRDLGYARNEAARLIRPGQRSGLLGVVITNIDNPYYAQVLLGVQQAAEQAGRLILTGISHNDAAVEAKLVADLLARQVEALIVVPASATGEHLVEASEEVPLVLASRAARTTRADTVLVDDVEGARTAVGALLADGGAPVAFVGGPSSIATAERRLEGYLLAHHQAGIEPDPSLIVRCPAERDTVQQEVRALVGRRDGRVPGSYFTTNNRYTTAALRVLLEAYPDRQTERPPVAGFDGFEFSDLMPYPVMVVDHDAKELGRLAAELALRRIEGDLSSPPAEVVMPTTMTRSGMPRSGSA